MTGQDTGPAPEVPQALHHSVRNSLIDRECTYTLESDQLSAEAKGGADRIPYADITSVQLIGYAGSGSRQFQARLKRRGGKPVKIRSHHYVSLGNFEDRTQTYAPFIRELCVRVADRSPDSVFVRGSTALWILWLIVCLLVAFVAILAVSTATLPGAPSWPAFLVLFGAVPLIWREARKGPKTRFDPRSPPQDLLGAD